MHVQHTLYMQFKLIQGHTDTAYLTPASYTQRTRVLAARYRLTCRLRLPRKTLGFPIVLNTYKMKNEITRMHIGKCIHAHNKSVHRPALKTQSIHQQMTTYSFLTTLLPSTNRLAGRSSFSCGTNHTWQVHVQVSRTWIS